MANADAERKKRQEWKGIFDMLDSGRSGAISAKELKIALKGMGLRLDETEVRNLVREYDPEGSEEIEFPEFCDIMTAKEKEIAVAESLGLEHANKRKKRSKGYQMSEDRELETRRVFQSFDTDGNGAIDIHELQSALRILGFYKTDSEVAEIMRQYDTDFSGGLSYTEFKNLITAESQQLAGMKDKFKAATQSILNELSKAEIAPIAPVDFTDWDSHPIKPPGKPGLATMTTFRGLLWVLILLECAIIVLFGACAKVRVTHDDFTNQYVMYGGIVFMMFFGFGYLMTFLKRYGMGAVGFTMLITVICMQWGILVEVRRKY
jgi:Ca2+-binding EF-hand superfamily protein